MICNDRLGEFLIELITYADDKDIKTFLRNCSEDLITDKDNILEDTSIDFYKSKLLNYLFEYIYGFIELRLPVLPPLIYEDGKLIRGLDIPRYQNFKKDISAYTHLYLHLYALCECYYSYQTLPKNKNQNMQNVVEEHIDIIDTQPDKIAGITNKDKTKLLKMFIDSFSENKFYYYFYDNKLIKLEIEAKRKNNKLDYFYKSTAYTLQDAERSTFILNQDNKICGTLKQKLLRQISEISIIDFYQSIVATGTILQHTSFQEIQQAHKHIVKALHTTDMKICKCCNPNVKNPKATKLCNNCKELFSKLNDLKLNIAEWEPNDYIDSIKEMDFKKYVYQVKLNEISDIVDLRKKRKKTLIKFINKLEKEIDNANNYNKLIDIINQLKPLIVKCFGE